MTYVDLIKADLKCIRLFVEGTDEADLNIAAYHCQQAVEKTCGYISQKLGISGPRTHKIEKWVEFLQEHSVVVPSIIDQKAEEISSWQSQSRYNINFVVAKREVKTIAEATEKWLFEFNVPQIKKTPSPYTPSNSFTSRKMDD